MLVDRLDRELNALAMAALETPEIRRFYRRPITWPAHRVRSFVMNRLFIPTNRHCWAYVMGGAPMDVKQVLWKHEEDELMFDPKLGRAHIDSDEDVLVEIGSPELVKQIESLDLPAGIKVSCYARVQFARLSPWLTGLAASHIIERMNDPVAMKGSSMSQRAHQALTDDLGVPMEEHSANSRVHLDADIEHGSLIWSVFQRHVTDEATYQQAIEGAKMGIDCIRAMGAATADAMDMAEAERVAA